MGEGRRLRNVDLVEATVKAVERARGNLATAADVRAALAEFDATGFLENRWRSSRARRALAQLIALISTQL